MFRNHRVVFGALAIAALIGFAAPALAQAPYSEAAPTKKDPLRFEAFAVQMQNGISGMVETTIERWTTEDERNALVALLAKTTDKDSDQAKLVSALQKIKERCGYLNLPNTMGWDIKYAYEATLPDGTRQVVIITDRPTGFAMAASGNANEAPLTMIEYRFPKGSNQGEGKLLASASLYVKNGRLEIGGYVNEPTRLTQVKEKNPKVKK